MHGTSVLKYGYYGPEKISYTTAVREDGTADQLREVAKFMPEEWDGQFDEQRQYVVGLSSVERELLSLNPMVKYVTPWKPEFQMMLAFD